MFSCNIYFPFKKKVLCHYTFFLTIFLLVFSTPYFKERLLYSDNNLNLSLLILLDGWERAYLANIITHGIGIGFNQLGHFEITGFFRGLMTNINAANINLYDGGTTSCKIVAEFGLLLGLLFVVYYLFIIKKNLINFLKLNKPSSSVLALNSFYIGSFLELFIRGTGYFNPGIIMLFVTLLNEKIKAKNKKLLVNAGSLFSGGTLSIAHEVLNDFVNSNQYDIYCIVNDKKLFNDIKVNYIVVSWIKKLMVKTTIYFEIIHINYIILKYNLDILFNCHDMTSLLL